MISTRHFHQNSGARSLYRLKKWAGLIDSDRDVDDKTYSMLTGLFHVNSTRLLDYWIRYINGDHMPRSEAEVLMRNMLYYTFYKKHLAKMGFADIDAGIDSVVHEDFLKDEVLQILQYNRTHVDFVSVINEYPFTCPLDLHCQYNTNQIMAAFRFFYRKHSIRNSARVSNILVIS